MSQFKVIYRADLSPNSNNRILWEPGCPLIFEAVQISRNTQSGETYLQARLKNVSGATIEGFQAEIVINYQDGTTEVVRQHPLDADIKRGDSFTLADTPLRQGDAISAEAAIVAIESKGLSWVSSGAKIEAPKPIPLGISEDAAKERYYLLFQGSKAPMDAAGNDILQNDNWWVCPCGQINVDRETCLNCSSSISSLTNRELIHEEKLVHSYAERMRVEQERSERQAKIKKKAIGLSLAGLIAIAAIAAAIFYVYNYIIVPDQIYAAASEEMSAANYDEAHEKFASLEDYKDSKEKAQEAEEKARETVYENALAYFNSGQYEKSYELFRSLGDYEDAVSKSEEAKECSTTVAFLVPKEGGVWTNRPPNIRQKTDDSGTLKVQFNSDLTCEFIFVQSYIKRCEGTWSPVDKEVVLEDCPYGNTWKIENMEYDKIGDYTKSIQVRSMEYGTQVTLRR